MLENHTLPGALNTGVRGRPARAARGRRGSARASLRALIPRRLRR